MTWNKSTSISTGVGSGVEHESAIKHVTGEARYIDDHPPFGDQLYVSVGGSEVAAGSISLLNLDAVRQASGVVDVITVHEIPGQVISARSSKATHC